MSENESKNSYGSIRAKVTTAGNTMPVKNAVVYISSYGEGAGSILYSLRTNEDGLTPFVELDAPSAENSQIPGGVGFDYSSYNMTVKKNGYYTVQNIGIPIFSGISATQPVILMPLSDEDASSDGPKEIYYYENNGYENLNGEAEN